VDAEKRVIIPNVANTSGRAGKVAADEEKVYYLSSKIVIYAQ